MKEYGGYIALEAYGSEFYGGSKDGCECLRLNAARYAIAEACRDGNFRKIWVPFYICDTVYRVLEEESIEYASYHIDINFMPELDCIEKDECILVINYFGILGEKFYQNILETYQNVIFDNTQSFYAKPIWKDYVYNVYSARKFFGVSDGAYLITKRFYKKHMLQKDFSAERACFLLKAKELGTNDAYAEYLLSEEDLSKSRIRAMSVLTQTMLCNIDYEKVAERRRRNFLYLSEKLENKNELKIDDKYSCPMVYPFLTEANGKSFRQYLVESRIYVPQWWKWVLSMKGINEWEYKLSQFLYSLPIDQRYSKEDMKDIVDIIRRYRG